MLSKALSYSTLSRLAPANGVASQKAASKSGNKAAALGRRLAACKKSQRSYATISVAGGAASTVVEDKLVRMACTKSGKRESFERQILTPFFTLTLV